MRESEIIIKRGEGDGSDGGIKGNFKKGYCVNLLS